MRLDGHADQGNAELGPVAICFEVPKRAYMITPAAASYRPLWMETLATAA
jgi:hypothetical protein